jgi:Fe-S-cluster containining protein
MPGMLVPEDIDAIRAHTGRTIESLTTVSPGALVGKYTAQGLEMFRVPTLVPRRKADGSCIFLTDDGQCSIHEVAPFGCAYFDPHMTNRDADPRSQAAVEAIVADKQDGGEYTRTIGVKITFQDVCEETPEQARGRMMEASLRAKGVPYGRP